MPERVEAEVVLLAFGNNAVELYAERICSEKVSTLAVVKCVEQHDYVIVAAYLFAPRESGSDVIGLVLAYEDHVQVFIIVRQIGFCRLACRSAVARLALSKIRDSNFFVARRAAEIIFQSQWLCHFRYAQREGLCLNRPVNSDAGCNDDGNHQETAACAAHQHAHFRLRSLLHSSRPLSPIFIYRRSFRRFICERSRVAVIGKCKLVSSPVESSRWSSQGRLPCEDDSTY